MMHQTHIFLVNMTANDPKRTSQEILNLKYMKKILVGILVYLSAVTCYAEKTIPEYLTSTPATLMDKGLDDIAKMFRFYIEKFSTDFTVSPYWNKEENFVLKVDFFKRVNKNVALERCDSALWTVKDILGINPKTGNPRNGVTSKFGAYFESYGSNYGDSALDFRKQIDTMVTLKGNIETTEGKHISCTSKLIE